MHLTKSLVIALLFALTLCSCDKPAQIPSPEIATRDSINAIIEQAFVAKKSGVQAEGQGTVVKLLTDDKKGAQHQRFLVEINPEQTLLFAHNIDLAARVPLQVGDEITFNGEYVYNPKGGIVHWTHHDPQGTHQAGWVMLRGQKYQ